MTFTKKIIKNIARFSNSQHYKKNINWFRAASKENAQFMYFDGSCEHPIYTIVGDFIDMKYFDLIGVRTAEEEEWNFIPLPLLVDIVFGKNIPEKTKIKKYVSFISSCDFYTTREAWEGEYTA